jgi:hypothetical protein
LAFRDLSCHGYCSLRGDPTQGIGIIIEIGKLADLIVVGANPLDDIENVRDLRLVLQEGRVVSDKRGQGDRPPPRPAVRF